MLDSNNDTAASAVDGTGQDIETAKENNDGSKETNGSTQNTSNVNADPEALSEPEIDPNLPPPTPDLDSMFYGLVGDLARAGSRNSEANPVGIAMVFLSYLSAMFARDAYLPVGDTRHHARLFTCQVGRTSEGRKGDALAPVMRVHRWMKQSPDASLLGHVHEGGLSTQEGIIRMIHDGYGSGKNYEDPIPDKRLWIVESELGGTLAKFKSPGNTLSTGLRNLWDGVTLAPATKHARISATDPHVAIAGGITPRDLKDLMSAREIANGFANRFMFVWAERTGLVPVPKPMPEKTVEELGKRTAEAIKFAKGNYPNEKNTRAMALTPDAENLYGELYLTDLNKPEEVPVWNDLLQRRAPMLLRIAMVFALTDRTLEINEGHIRAALAWVHYWAASVRFVFARHEDMRQASLVEIRAEKIMRHLQQCTEATRTDLADTLFQKRLKAAELDAAINALFMEKPPRIEQSIKARQDIKGGRVRKVYRLAGIGM
jgi:hypothetical protein